MKKIHCSKESNQLFDFCLIDLIKVELEDWPDNKIKVFSRWNSALKEFDRHKEYVNELTFETPYPIISYSIGAAALTDNLIRVRLFLFPYESPRFQIQSVGQIICEINHDSESSDMKVWTDFLEINEIEENTKKQILIGMTLRFIDKFVQDYPKKFILLNDENEISKLDLSAEPDKSSQMFHITNTASILRFIDFNIKNNKTLAIYFPDNENVIIMVFK